MMDYAVLKLVWWVLIGVLLIGFSIMGGSDIGTANLLPFLGKKEDDRRLMINTIAPHWDGNQVWLITAGGAMFAAWPIVYATAFSGFYWAMLFVLFALMIRPLALEYRAKIDQKRWKKLCDSGLFISGVIPSVVFGVAFGNLFQGYGFNLDLYMRSSFTGTFLSLLNPFALLCGIISLLMLSMQGATWQGIRVGAPIKKKAHLAAQICAGTLLLLFTIAGVWVAKLPGFTITSTIHANALANPLIKQVMIVSSGRWIENYSLYPWMLSAPIVSFIGLIGVFCLARSRFNISTFICSSMTQAGIIATAGFSLFPFILPSSTNPNVSLTVWDATSSYLTLSIMSIAALIFIPLILIYTGWCVYNMWGRITIDDVTTERGSY